MVSLYLCSGYMAPEYAMRGYLTDKADVYSFGIVALEIVSGKCNTSHRGKEDTIYLLDWALFLKEEGTLLELVDPSLGQDYNEEEVITMINVALLCSNVSATVRPAMSAVVSMLEGKAAVQDFDIADKSKSMDEHKIEEMRKHFQVINRQEISETQTQSMSMDGPWTAASTSDGDLYPVSLNSDYLKGRD
ncbi:LRR RECEPTOR-LIKE SERINE/THREONINE-PROTEIN KINASE-RELATED [Salix purpurea]|uniref:LRR RECEPTOR-LIKE SERINE/THREONINE-PROTEIN KINASE-RELATED n=1 Tax=Salix purpurea TaxID=77065 RepID=A0A9Q0VSB1_SALPP|nr:LRR RECEPTOR-LIKE SERINE/THREONINE-PROTEIN KINASE-RELATED [Salix purpurea]